MFVMFIDLAENETLNREAAEQSDVIPAGQKFTMDNFTYANSVVVSRMFEHLKNTNFPGITVCSKIQTQSIILKVIFITSINCYWQGNKVTFNDVGTRQVDRVRILQYQRNSDGKNFAYNSIAINCIMIDVCFFVIDLKRVEVGAVVDIEGNNTFQTNNDTFIYPG